ncbi:hypothetical protein DJ68_00075 [Halorubrum sp. C3]|nr:hypothetical protein DJ68_00075 [Halorubrum sp. C3]
MAVLVVDLLSAIYKRAAGALAVFVVDLFSAISKRAAGALAVFVIRPRPTVYKTTSGDPAPVYRYSSNVSAASSDSSWTCSLAPSAIR